LPPQERLAVREAIIEDGSDALINESAAEPQLLIAEQSEEIRQRPTSEETVITPKP
jgi:hypothetical protein